jgi:hypothetical protein
VRVWVISVECELTAAHCGLWPECLQVPSHAAIAPSFDARFTAPEIFAFQKLNEVS